MLLDYKTRPPMRGRLMAVALALALGGWWGAPAGAQEGEPAAAPPAALPAAAPAPGPGARLSDSDRIVVALLPVLIHSLGDQNFLRDGLHDMLLSRLGRDQRLAVVPVRDESAATTDLEAARAVARSAGARFVIYGSMTHFGDGASVDMACAAVDGDAFGPREVFVHAGTLGEVIPTLDGLADRITRFILEGPILSEATAVVGDGSVEAPSAGELQDLVRRVEALERALDPALAVEEEIEVPSIFQVYPEDGESAPN